MSRASLYGFHWNLLKEDGIIRKNNAQITYLLNLPVLLLSLTLGLSNCTRKVKLHATLKQYITSMKGPADVMQWAELGNVYHNFMLTKLPVNCVLVS